MGKDDGLDSQAKARVAEQVRAWRRAGQLPFPRFAPERLERIDDTLDYPPKGSPEAGHEDFEAAAGAERLSAEPLPDEELQRDDEAPQEEVKPKDEDETTRR